MHNDTHCNDYTTASGITCAVNANSSFKLSFTNDIVDFQQLSIELGSQKGYLQYDSITNLADTSTYNIFNYNGVVYQVTELGVLKPPLNTYSSPNVPCEIVLILENDDHQSLIIYIPVNNGVTTNIPLPQDSTVHINFQKYIPSAKPFYYYYAPYNCSDASATGICSLTTPYVIFSADSSNLTITTTDANNLCKYLGQAITQVGSTGPTTYECRASQSNHNDFLSYYVTNNAASNKIQQVYYQAIGVNTEVPDSNDIYIKCNPTDSSGNLLENYGTVPNEGSGGNEGGTTPAAFGKSFYYVVTILIILIVVIGIIKVITASTPKSVII
jgi:hypothetical protein